MKILVNLVIYIQINFVFNYIFYTFWFFINYVFSIFTHQLYASLIK